MVRAFLGVLYLRDGVCFSHDILSSFYAAGYPAGAVVVVGSSGTVDAFRPRLVG
jgi:hypothetical protein